MKHEKMFPPQYAHVGDPDDRVVTVREELEKVAKKNREKVRKATGVSGALESAQIGTPEAETEELRALLKKHAALEGCKDTNPKDAVGVRKWRQFFAVPQRVLWEIGVGMLEGAMKYGRHNYRESGVQASVYTDAAMGHLSSWIEGEDIDPDSGLSHVTKAICSLMVLRDGMLEGNFTDDRPPRHADFEKHRDELQAKVEELFTRYPEPVQPFVERKPGNIDDRMVRT